MQRGALADACRLLATALLLAAAPVIVATPLRAEQTTSVHGQLSVGLDDLSLEDAGGVVVFLEPEGSRPVAPTREPADRARPSVSIRQRGARFEPDFLVVSRGQTVRMPNDDVIYHNVFSYSEPNAFDLGMYAAGQSRTVRFEHGGLVRIYCSIHDEMDGLIFVAPSPLFAVPDSTGRFAIGDVPPGAYRLRAWSERLPEVARTLTLEPGDAARVDLVLGRATAPD